jgi:hypothetical protein
MSTFAGKTVRSPFAPIAPEILLSLVSFKQETSTYRTTASSGSTMTVSHLLEELLPLPVLLLFPSEPSHRMTMLFASLDAVVV